MNASVAVVGAGLGGLATAALLARAGASVTVFERSPHVGGRATSQQLGGAWFNQGPHALYRRGPAMRVLSELGVQYSGKVPSTSGTWALRAGQIMPLPSSGLALLSSALLTRAERVDLIRFFARLHVLPVNGLDDVPLDAFLQSALPREGSRAFVQALTRVTTYTNAPAEMSAGAALIQMRGALRHNVMYLDDGWQSLVDGLRSVAEKAGAKIITSAHVTGIDCADGAVRGVRLGGELIPASSVVLAVSPRVASTLVEGGNAALSKAAEDARPVHAACLDVALDHLPVPAHTFALGIDQPLYFSVHTKYARLGPDGVHVVHAAKYLALDETGIAARPALEALIDVMQPGWRAYVLDQRFMPQLTVMQTLPRAGLGGMQGRPATAVPSIAGPYVVGDWVGPEGMLADAVFASASSAARQIATSEPTQQVSPKRGRMVA